MHQAESRLHSRLLALQREEHRERAEQRVLFLPRDGGAAQQQVLGRCGAERREPGRDPLGVGAQERALLLRQGLNGASRHRAQPQQAHLTVDRDRGLAEELGELARRAPAREVHLEEALLRVQEAGGARDVGTAPAAHDGDAVRVALDTDGRREARQRPLAVELRQAGREALPQVRVAAARDDPEQREHDEPAPPGDGQRHACPRVWFATAWAARFAASGSPR